MDRSKRVEMLANGLGNEMSAEIAREVESIESTLQELGVSPSSLRPESQFALKRLRGFIPESERIAASLFNYERKVGDIKRGAGVKDIIQMEEQLPRCGSMQEAGRIKRQILHLKSIHSRKLSELVTNEQQLLQERLRLINIWKSILNYEIHILEECKTSIVKNIVTTANSSGDTEIVEMVRERLRSMSVKDSIIDNLKLDLTALKVANIHVLHKTLNEQLNDIGRIETAVEEKRQIVQVLSAISRDIRRQLPNPPPEPVLDIPLPSSDEKKESSKTSSSETGERKSRMVFREDNK